MLGARQTGKTTLIDRLPAAKYFTLANLKNRLRYEKDPTALASEIGQLAAQKKTKNLVALPWQQLFDVVSNLT